MRDNIRGRRLRDFEQHGYGFAAAAKGSSKEPVCRNKFIADADYYKRESSKIDYTQI